MSLSIRQPRNDEAALVLSFVHELAEYEKLSHEVDSTESMIGDALFGPQPRVYCDLAEWDGVPAGFSLWFVNYSSFRGRHGIHLEDLFVRPAFRGQGIGKGLLAVLAQRCIENGWARLEWSVLDWNAPSIAFYKMLGAKTMDDWTVCRLSGPALVALAQGPP